MHFLAPERWARVDALFEAALERPADERTAFLRGACGDEPEVYRAVSDLLSSTEAAERAIGEDAAAFAAHLLDEAAAGDTDLDAGTVLGPYRVLGELGHGGMGTVYRVERADGAFRKELALKLVKRGMDTDEIVARFRAERQILSGLDHPGISRLVDAGAAPDGRPYLVMELVDGRPITSYADDRSLGVGERLDLFEQVCEAVAYAHRHLVVHRDLKPSNVLVADDETGAPRVKLLDFGVARLLADREDAGAPLTRAEQRLATPEYAAPEQLRGDTPTTAVDVFALGILLHELLVGERPARPPALPGARVSPEAAASRSTTPARLAGVLRGDLETAILKTLSEEPERRYASADALLEDIRRQRRGLPLRARPDSRLYRARKFIGRHKWGALAGAAVLVGTLAFVGVLLAQRQALVRERDTAQATVGFITELLGAADPFSEPFNVERSDTLLVRDLLAPARARIGEQFADEPEISAALLQVIGGSYLSLGLFSEAVGPLDESVRLRRAGAGDAGLARGLIALSAARRETGDVANAEALAREAGAIAGATGDGALIGDAANARALALNELGRADEAAALLRATTRRLGASDVPATTLGRLERGLARAMLDKGDLDGSEAAYRRALAHFGPAGGAGRLGVLRDMTFLMLLRGRLDEAETFGRQAVAMTRTARPGSGSLANILSVYGAVLQRRGDLAGAERVLREALALPARRPRDRAAPLGTLATVLHSRGESAAAIAAQRESLEVLRAAGADARATAASALKLGGFLTDAGRYSEAEQLLLEAHDALPAGDAGHGPSRAGAAAALAALYDAWGRPADAARYR